nr:NADH dehydrogenase subunit 2 [Brachyponera chinensis]
MLMNKIIFNNFMILSLMFMINFLSLSLTDMFMIWFFMEISNFLFISFMLLNLNNKKMIFFYFLMQFISSSILIISITSNFLIYSNLFKLLTSMTLIFKLGIPPFHLWLLIMINYMNWSSMIIVLSIQKIIPFYIFSFNLFNSYIFWMILILSLSIPPFILLNIQNFKKIFFYSSMNQSSWFILLIYIKSLLWLIYFLIYSLIMIILIFFMNLFKINFNFSSNNSFKFNFFIMFMFFNFSSLPPFLFIMFKWLNIFISLNLMKFNFIYIILMMNSLIMLLIYIRMSYMFLYKKTLTNKFFTLNNNKFFKLKFVIMMFSILFSSILFIMY